jgi:chromate transport protein ChrA
MSVAMFAFFATLVFQMAFTALAILLIAFVIGCVWMWPRDVKEVM